MRPRGRAALLQTSLLAKKDRKTCPLEQESLFLLFYVSLFYFFFFHSIHFLDGSLLFRIPTLAFSRFYSLSHSGLLGFVGDICPAPHTAPART
jgi:hypothetical protein